MARPTVNREATEHTGIRKVTRIYDDGREVVKYELRLRDLTGALGNEGTYATEALALQALGKATARLQDGTHVRQRAGSVLFLAVADEWLAHGDWKARTRDTNARIVRVNLADLHRVPVGKVSYDHVRRQMTKHGGLAPSTRRRILAVLRAVLSDAVDRDLIAKNPCDKLDKIKGRKRTLSVPTPAQVELLIATLPAPWDLLVELAAYTGLRAGEIAGLRVRNLDLTRGVVTVEETVIDIDGDLTADTPKSDAGYRDVGDLDPSLVLRLAAHVAGRAPGDYVFGGRDSDGMPRPYRHGNFVSRCFKPACRAVGLPTTRFHDLRHFNASLLFDEGLSAVAVAARLGHHDAAFTLRTYAHLLDADRDSDLSSRIAARRAEARGDTVVPLRVVVG
jgi:integrase